MRVCPTEPGLSVAPNKATLLGLKKKLILFIGCSLIYTALLDSKINAT
jgi:hypothetical protein